VYCTAGPAIVCLHLSASANQGPGSAAAALSKIKPKRNRNSVDIGYDKKSLHQVGSFHVNVALFSLTFTSSRIFSPHGEFHSRRLTKFKKKFWSPSY
jgi:hypothetical protein